MKRSDSVPVRKKLSHEIPSWVPDNSRYFITINAHARNTDELLLNQRSAALVESIKIYEERKKWWIHLFVVMPDHVHMIATFNRSFGIQPVITSWKGYLARTQGITWQTGFFEHRLRNDSEFTEKASYVRMNPVRKGLVQDWQAWPHLVQRGLWDE